MASADGLVCRLGAQLDVVAEFQSLLEQHKHSTQRLAYKQQSIVVQSSIDHNATKIDNASSLPPNALCEETGSRGCKRQTAINGFFEDSDGKSSWLNRGRGHRLEQGEEWCSNEGRCGSTEPELSVRALAFMWMFRTIWGYVDVQTSQLPQNDHWPRRSLCSIPTVSTRPWFLIEVARVE
jgi:hypothetical protein